MSDRIEQKLDNIDNRLDNIDTKLAVYNEQLKVHIKRTTQIEEELKPVIIHVERVKGVFIFLGLASTVAGLVTFIMSI